VLLRDHHGHRPDRPQQANALARIDSGPADDFPMRLESDCKARRASQGLQRNAEHVDLATLDVDLENDARALRGGVWRPPPRCVLVAPRGGVWPPRCVLVAEDGVREEGGGDRTALIRPSRLKDWADKKAVFLESVQESVERMASPPR
jgi:hypothetical protein